MISIREERMSDAMMKYHLDGLPFTLVLHHFTAPDIGDPHDHPFQFRSTILEGWYAEERYDRGSGKARHHVRRAGESFTVEASVIHRITGLAPSGCWTLMQPLGPKVQEPGFYQFRRDGTYFRHWNEREFRQV